MPVQRFWPWFYSGFAGFARLPPKVNVCYLGLSPWSLRWASAAFARLWTDTPYSRIGAPAKHCCHWCAWDHFNLFVGVITTKWCPENGSSASCGFGWMHFMSYSVMLWAQNVWSVMIWGLRTCLRSWNLVHCRWQSFGVTGVVRLLLRRRPSVNMGWNGQFHSRKLGWGVTGGGLN